jgi:hypothetical protein
MQAHLLRQAAHFLCILPFLPSPRHRSWTTDAGDPFLIASEVGVLIAASRARDRALVFGE